NGDNSAIRELKHLRAPDTEMVDRIGHHAPCILANISTSSDPGFQNACQRRAGLNLFRSHPINLSLSTMGDDDSAVGTEQAQPLRHVVDGCTEARVLRSELCLSRLQHHVLLLQLCSEFLTFGDVLMCCHPPAVRPRLDGYRNRASVPHCRGHVARLLPGHPRTH